MKITSKSHLFKYFWMAIKGLYIGDLGYENSREFFCTKSLILSKTTLSYPLKTFLGQNTCKFNKELLSDLHCIIFLLKERILLLFFYFWKGVKRPRVSCCKGFLNTKEGLSLCGSDFVKGVLQREWKISSGLLKD